MITKTFDELTIVDNYMFSKVMLNQRLCKRFLEMVLGVKIQKITFPSYERAIDIRYDAKSIRLDVILEDEKHTTYNLEIQATKHDYLIKRTRYYQDLIDLDLIEKGQMYGELNPCMIIFICTFDPFDKGRHIYSFENLCVEDTSLALEDGTRKIFVNTVGTADDIDDEFREVLNFFNGLSPQGEFAKELQAEVEKVKSSEKWRREYMTLEIFMDDARREERKAGRAEGRAEGQAEGAEIYLIQMVCKKLSKGKTIDEIAEDLEEDYANIERIAVVAEKNAPEYNVETIYKELHGTDADGRLT